MQLTENKRCFDWAFTRACHAAKEFRDAAAMAWANVAGRLTYGFHPGFYAHPELEQLLLSIGSRHAGGIMVPNFPGRLPGQKHWVHVLTTALPVGGHTRLVEKWIHNACATTGDRHSVILLDQGDNSCPEWLVEAAEFGGGMCLALPDHLDPLGRALALRDLVRTCADMVVLHTHPYDPIPTVAFAEAGGPPVVLVNHADHVFWLGVSVTDLVADIRPVGQRLSLQRRGARRSALLPIPLLAPENLSERSVCRERLGLPGDKTLLLSVGTSYKYKAFGNLDFPGAMLETARRNPGALILVIGPSADEPAWQKVIEQGEGSIRVLGVVRGIQDYYRAADIYLEGFPIGSGTASLDAALAGTPVVRAPMLISALLGIDPYPGMNSTAGTMEDYYLDLDRFIRDTDFRIAAAAEQKATVEDGHMGQGWDAHLKRLIDLIPATHEPATSVGEPDMRLEDAVWADLQAAQIHEAGGLWRGCCAALRANATQWGGMELITSLLQCPARAELTPNPENIKELAKFLIVLLVPRSVFGCLLDRRRFFGRWFRGKG